MPATPDAKADSAAALDPNIQPGAPWRVVSVTPMPGYKLQVRFIDGVEGEVHMKGLLTSSSVGVFATLRDERTFEKVHLRWGAVTWPGELDLAPDAMHDDIKSRGVCIVGPFEN